MDGDGAEWVITGGRDKGGLVVRGDESVNSEAFLDRLATGSVVRELNRVGDRLFYKKLEGKGPDLGWISVKLKNSTLAVRKDELVEQKVEVGKTNKMLGLALNEEREEFWPFENSSELCVRIAKPRDGAKAPCCAVFVGGMPQQIYGSPTMLDSFPSVVMENCWEIGFPTVRFDYTGYGKSKGEPFGIEDRKSMPRDTSNILRYVLRTLSESVVIIAASAGNMVSSVPLLSTPEFNKSCIAFISVNMGHRSIAMVPPPPLTSKQILAMTPEEFFTMWGDGETPAKFEAIAHIPTVFIRASSDWMTPKVDVEYLIEKQTKKLGCEEPQAELLEFEGKHAFEGGKEKAPAEAIRHFLLKALSRS